MKLFKHHGKLFITSCFPTFCLAPPSLCELVEQRTAVTGQRSALFQLVGLAVRAGRRSQTQERANGLDDVVATLRSRRVGDNAPYRHLPFSILDLRFARGVHLSGAGGKLAPGGASAGRIVFNNVPVISGQVLMQISRNGPTLTNDQIQLTGGFNWQYDGSLTVTKAGATDLTAGNSFKLFEAAGYIGAFSSLSLPPLNAGLNWTNRLLVDGTIQVVSWQGPTIAAVVVSDGNVEFNVSGGVPSGTYEVVTSQNLTEPLTNWSVVSSGGFDWLGKATITGPFNLATPRRFFAVRVP